jgi:hypothetical protein
VKPAEAPNMPKIVVPAGSGAAIRTASGSRHYRFVGLEVTPTANTFVFNLVELGAGETSPATLPHDFVFDRCYLHGDPAKGTRRGIVMNGKGIAVIDSYLADFKDMVFDSQALWSSNGPGPFTIGNNYLEGAGENIMFGGADPTIPNLVPSDITIRRNHIAKPVSWMGVWPVKNLFELKNARRVLVEGNLFEYNWASGQSGFAIVFTPRNEGGTAPWSVVEDVTFRLNIVRHTGSGVNILGADTNFPSQQTQRILIQNNLFEDVNGPAWGGAGGRLWQVLGASVAGGAKDVTIDHNTAFQTGPQMVADGAPSAGFTYQNNLTHNGTGFLGSGTGDGNSTLGTYFPGAVFRKNSIIGGSASNFPPGNFFPPSLNDVQFVDRQRGDYRLSPLSRYSKAAINGRDIGADFGALSSVHGSDILRPNTSRLLPPRQ